MTQKPNKTLGIIGYGRFGKTLAQLLTSDYTVKIYDPTISADEDLAAVLSLPDIFIATPIRAFADTIKKMAPLISPQATVIDVCSVKIYPVKIMLQYLPKTVGIIATHPLFGPDSIQENNALKIVMHDTRDCHHRFADWQQFFTQKNITVLNMTPDEHDRLAAKTQSLTHFIGRCLQSLGATPTSIDTSGYKKLLSVMQHTCNDSVELFTDLIQFNPYSKKTIEQLISAAKQLQKTID